MMKKNSLWEVVLLVGALTGASAAIATPILQVTNGILTGALNVDVGGALYDVQFMDGSCDTLFGGCTAQNFAFTTEAAALTASQSLLDTVFINGPDGDFDTESELTRGCVNSAVCLALTPFGFGFPSGTVLVAAARNWSSLTPAVDSVHTHTTIDHIDLATESDETYALWTPAVGAAVPEPTTFALMAAGLFAATAFRRRRKQS
jgi:hypothetical protein